MIPRIVTSVQIEKFKQKAREIKREQNIPHTEALEVIAKRCGFDHWHQVTLCNAPCKASDLAISKGCVLAFDFKEAEEIGFDDELLIYDSYLELAIKPKMLEIYSNLVDEDDELGHLNKESLSPEELYEYGEEFASDFRYFRLPENLGGSSLKEVLELLKGEVFWKPIYIWLQGTAVDLYHLPAEDENGKIVGIRF
ncbi:plasmid-related protein [Psychromonas antarctica]|uniref:plasmid-related protein n=1 Tax=Psychromonas antarctica TaxID=67573 RepID=UPI001EE93914|nr:plasmid-related protein [Psychromonas antarctica]MCG6202945.1 plasmid-related protein [Psychromonas antarctica]